MLAGCLIGQPAFPDTSGNPIIPGYAADASIVLAAKVALTSLSAAVIDGFNYTGVYVGLYATGNGTAAGGYAEFDYLRYEPAADRRRDGYVRRVSSAARRDERCLAFC